MKINRIINFFLYLLVLLLSVSCGADNLRKDSAIRFKTKNENGSEVFGPTINIQYVKTEAERSQGLMYKDKISNNEGMFFVFPEDASRSFWMKNTYIPLDMIFISKSGEVRKVLENTVPLSSTPRICEEPVRYVLEVNAGISKRIKAEVGSIVEFLEQKP